MYQLLETSVIDSNNVDQRTGVELPPGFEPTSISLLTEPQDQGSSSAVESHRGILLLTSECNGVITCLLYQLQTIPASDSRRKRLAGEPDCRIFAKLARKETFSTVDNILDSSLSHANIFLAGASFNYNIARGESESSLHSFLLNFFDERSCNSSRR